VLEPDVLLLVGLLVFVFVFVDVLVDVLVLAPACS
jgi:hypothetical protein